MELIMEYGWLPEGERDLYASIVHNLRARGWSRIDAEDEAMDMLIELRVKRDPCPKL